MEKLSDFLESVASGKESHFDMIQFIRNVYSNDLKKDLDWGIEELCNKYNMETMMYEQSDFVDETKLAELEKKGRNVNRFRKMWNEFKNIDLHENENKDQKIEDTFSNYIVPDNKEQIISVLHDWLKNKKGKEVAIIIKALQISNIITYSNSAKFYRSMRDEFGNIGTDQGLNYYLNNSVSNNYQLSLKDDDREIISTINLIKTTLIRKII